MAISSPRRLIISLLSLGFTWSPLVAAELDAQLARFVAWFPGEYDNYEQNWQDQLDKVAQPHEHIHHIFYPVDAPAIGEHVFFVQQYMNGDPDNIYRQRLYKLTSDPQEQAIRLTIYSFKDEARYRNGYDRPEIFPALQQEELIARPGCEVYWKPEGDFFHGYMKERACSFISERSGKTIYITDDLRLTPNEIWIRDEAFLEDGSRVFGNEAGVHHKNRKVQYYKGWAGVSSRGPTLALGEANWQQKDGNWAFVGDLDNFSQFVIHNEGQIVSIRNKAGEASGYSVQLARLTYQNTAAPVLTLKLIEDASGKTMAYSWSGTAAPQLGINTRWAQTGVTLKPGDPSFGFVTAE